jgi:hypothetical protein
VSNRFDRAELRDTAMEVRDAAAETIASKAAALKRAATNGRRPLRDLLQHSNGNGSVAGVDTMPAQRLGKHIAYGVATALALELLAEWRRRHGEVVERH